MARIQGFRAPVQVPKQSAPGLAKNAPSGQTTAVRKPGRQQQADRFARGQLDDAAELARKLPGNQAHTGVRKPPLRGLGIDPDGVMPGNLGGKVRQPQPPITPEQPDAKVPDPPTSGKRPGMLRRDDPAIIRTPAKDESMVIPTFLGKSLPWGFDW